MDVGSQMRSVFDYLTVSLVNILLLKTTGNLILKKYKLMPNL